MATQPEKETQNDALPESGSTSNRTLFVWSALALLAAAVFVYLLFFKPSNETNEPFRGTSHPAVGSPLSKLQLEPLTGTEQGARLEDLKGNVVLINYWGTWCPPCLTEFPQLVALEKRLRSEPDFRFLPVSCGRVLDDEEPSELKQKTVEFLRESKVDMPTYADPDGVSRLALIETAELRGFVFPTTMLLDRKGVIRALWIGYNDAYEHEMQVIIAQVLAER